MEGSCLIFGRQPGGSDPVLYLRRAFKINELKTEVTNRLAMLEKRVERKYRDVCFC